MSSGVPALRSQRGLEKGEGLLVGVCGQGLLACDQGVVDQLRRACHRLGLGEMARQLRGVEVRLRAVELLKARPNTRVKPDATRYRQLFQQRLLQ